MLQLITLIIDYTRRKYMENVDLSVVIPCLNEEETIGICIDKCLNMFNKMGIQGEVIVSDNGSKDKSIEISKDLGAKVLHCADKGYGITLRTGFNNAGGKYILMADADNSYDFHQIDNFYNKIQEGYDMVLGTRLNGFIHKGAMPFLHRYLGTPVLTSLVNIFWGLNITDSQSGMRIFKKESLDKIKFECKGMEFATELLTKAAAEKWLITEIPIEFFRDGRSRKPHLRPWRDGIRHLKLIIKTKLMEYSV